METLANLESFVRSAEAGGFSAAARRLSLTPAAVSRNVATLERNLGVRLFQRSTRKLTLTDAGERFLSAIRANLEGLQASIASVAAPRGPTGVLKVSAGPTFGIEHILPLLPEFLRRYPGIRIDWSFEHRPVDLIGRIRRRNRRRVRAAASCCVARPRATSPNRCRFTSVSQGAHSAFRAVRPRSIRRHTNAFVPN